MNEITNYCLYYLPKGSEGLNDVLMVYFGGNTPITERQEGDGFITFLNGRSVLGFALLDFSEHAKIKINGTIYLPNEYLISIINSIFENAGILIHLNAKEESGFVVGKVLEKNEYEHSFLYKVDIKSEIINVESTYDIEPNLFVCIAKKDTYLLPGRMIQQYENKHHDIIKGRICTYDDLQMEVSNSHLPLLMQEDELEIGQDFFLMEEKNNDGSRA